MLLAVDLDNTIICYDALFVQIAAERGLIQPEFAGGKQALRDIVRQSNGGERAWQALQADVYGERIAAAQAYPGARDVLRDTCGRGVRIAIVSHKTMFAGARTAGPNLRAAAERWLREAGLVGSSMIAPHDVYFESTRAEKIERIRELRARIVIDDLLEVFSDGQFPRAVRRWLFAPRPAASISTLGPCVQQEESGASCPIEPFATWDEMGCALRAEAAP